jgi:Hydrazine synthase alpha subunit middle domain
MVRGHRSLFVLVFMVLSAGAAVVGSAPPGPTTAPDLGAECRAQHDKLSREMADRAWCAAVADQTADHAALIDPSDRDPADVVIRRSAALLAYLQSHASAPDLAREAGALADLRAAAGRIALTDTAARYDLYERACRLRRRIAFANPLLDFDRVIFMAKHRPMRGDHHMVDQYYGFNARPGGGVLVLEGPFTDEPRVRKILEGATIANGRLAGRTLAGGAFNTLDLDYDGRSILFAWSECGGVPEDASWDGQPWSKEQARADGKPYYYWSPPTTYHVFRAGVDGSALVQLTDGPWNEFDPCFLPSGRIAFISERRGGFLRCGGNRPNPTYTLFGMMGDGSDVIPLSFHETQEWNPSVDEQGMIVYTRWDYIDRDDDGAHHLWTCYPDGRDPRSAHGNYPMVRERRPWTEMSIRAVPGTTRYVAVAAAHHGYAYGSLILIDPAVEDDGAMSQIKRLTPEAHFPEAESAPGVPHDRGHHDPRGEFYGTPWPLSDAFFLCVYDSAQSNYGIYLVDRFGNKELLWRDPQIACLDPIPLRPRRRPPILPVATTQARADQGDGEHRPATIAVMNVYESDFDWPEGSRVAALRVVQLFPKSTYHMHRPMVGKADQSLARGVIGVVPVESDGSAYFEAPVGAPIYFQALDAHGRAVQSMRSATYVHPGEQMSCVGCHEKKREAPRARPAVPLAMRRPPSKPAPDVEGAYPLTFPRLVQPVLDRQCVACHRERAADGAPDLTGTPSGKFGWTRAFVSLAPFAWGYEGGNGTIRINGMRSIPGKLGAYASPLYHLLNKGHYDVKLPDEDMHRITLWLDCNSNFYGAYVGLEQQAAGQCITPKLR